MVDMSSTIWAPESWCFNSALTEDLPLVSLAQSWLLRRSLAAASGTKPWVNLRAIQARGGTMG